MQQNGGSILSTRAGAGSDKPYCFVCHAPGGWKDLNVAHGLK
jgi:hypothetical protein